MPYPKFNIGQKITFKDTNELEGGDYYYKGSNYGGQKGGVRDIKEYIANKDCYKISVITPAGAWYDMLESEFYEFDNESKPEHPVTVKKVVEETFKKVKTESVKKMVEVDSNPIKIVINVKPKYITINQNI